MTLSGAASEFHRAMFISVSMASGSISAKGSATFGDVQVKESVGLWDGEAQNDVEEEVSGQVDVEWL